MSEDLILSKDGKPFVSAAVAGQVIDLIGGSLVACEGGYGICLNDDETEGDPAGEAEDTTVDTDAHEAATSPRNDLPEPTDAQKHAGNYAVGATSISGLRLSIENPQESERRGTDPTGKEWSITMKSHYGYIRGSEGADSDHVDAFVKPGTPKDYAGPVFVIDQVDQDGTFDEHKSMIGWADEASARRGYLENYSDGWSGLGAITRMTMDEFKAWLAGDTSKPVDPKLRRGSMLRRIGQRMAA